MGPTACDRLPFGQSLPARLFEPKPLRVSARVREPIRSRDRPRALDAAGSLVVTRRRPPGPSPRVAVEEHPMSFAQYPSLQGKPVIVTGGASGIGEATVRAFAAQGARIGFVDMDAERGAALAAELGAAGHTAQFARCDLREVSELKAAFASLAKAHGPARVLVNNAARDDRHRWQDVEPEYWDE